jgi:hypothetical protein
MRILWSAPVLKGKNGPVMSEDSSPEKKGARQPYEAPRIIRVSLRPDEAVLGHCKISGSAGPASGSCGSMFCKTPGS